MIRLVCGSLEYLSHYAQNRSQPKQNPNQILKSSVFGLGSAWVENGSEHSVISIVTNCMGTVHAIYTIPRFLLPSYKTH